MFSFPKQSRMLSKLPCAVKNAKRAAGALAIWLAVLCTPAFLAAQDTPSRKDTTAPIRIALSAGSIIGVNHNDMLAAIKTWARAILKLRDIDMDVDTRIIYRPEELAEALRNGQADAASMSMNEFQELKTKPEFIFISTRKNSFTEQYVLLVHRNSDITDIGGLRGRKLLLHNSLRMSLASSWVAALLGLSEKEAAGITRIDNASRTVLPVFFRQADACVVTSSVFEIASELNPQLQKELRVLASSPEVVPSVFFFRPGYASHAKGELEAAMLTLHESPAGQQVLMLFQGDGMVKQPISCLESTRQMLDESVRSRRIGKGNILF
ncbi:MAG: PhnD/SsuA/transferrin family substrate-binding protein [Pseudomonadota bacterium]